MSANSLPPGASSLQATAQLDQLLAQRRTIKPEKFSSRDIPRETLQELLEAAQLAPTHKLTEPWLFTIFTGSGREKLGAYQAALYERVTDPKSFKFPKQEKIRNRPSLAPAVIALGVRPHPEKLPQIEEIAAASCAIQNLMLAASARGISSYWGSGGVTYRSEMVEWLGWQPGDLPLGYLYLGYTDHDPGPRRRQLLEQRVRWVEE